MSALQERLNEEQSTCRTLSARVQELTEENSRLKADLRWANYKGRDAYAKAVASRVIIKKPRAVCGVKLTQCAAHKLQAKKKKISESLEGLLDRHFIESTDKVLECYFERHISQLKWLCDMVKDGEVQKAVSADFSKAVTEAWQYRSFAVKTRVAYSDEQYMRLKHMLGGIYNGGEDTFKPLLVNGVEPPNLASLRVIRDKSSDLRKEMRITSWENGASMSLIAKLASTIKIRGITRANLWLQFCGDAARMGHIQQTAVAFRIMGVGKRGESNSPFTTYTLILYEGDDSYTALSAYTERMIKEMTRLGQEGLTVTGRDYKFTYFGGGDLKYINAVLGLATCAHRFGCPFCTVTSDRLSETARCMPRTLERARIMAHDTIGKKCPGCSCTFDSHNDAKAADPTNETQRKAYQTQHQGQRPHGSPLLPILTKNYIPCILHVMLRLVDHLFSHTVRFQIQGDEGREKRVRDALIGLGIHINPEKKIQKESKDIAKKKAMKKVSFQGRACKSILNKAKKAGARLNGYECIVDAMGFPTRGEMTAPIAKGLWGALADLIHELSDIWDEEGDMYDAEKQGIRDEHAEKAEELATTYLKLVEDAFGKDAVTLYMHVCVMHMCTFIKAVGSLSRWSMQALEASHWLRKQNRARACNFKKQGTHTKGGGSTEICYMNTELTKQEGLARVHSEIEERPKKHHKVGL